MLVRGNGETEILLFLVYRWGPAMQKVKLWCSWSQCQNPFMAPSWPGHHPTLFVTDPSSFWPQIHPSLWTFSLPNLGGTGNTSLFYICSSPNEVLRCSHKGPRCCYSRFSVVETKKGQVMYSRSHTSVRSKSRFPMSSVPSQPLS